MSAPHVTATPRGVLVATALLVLISAGVASATTRAAGRVTTTTASVAHAHHKAKRHPRTKRRIVVKVASSSEAIKAASAVAPGLSASGSVSSGSIVVGGLSRTYLIDVPSVLPAKTKVPLLVMFHGSSNTAAGIEAATGFDQIADRDGFIVVYPQGVDDTWNDGRGTSAASVAGVDDVGFAKALVGKLESTYPIDVSRVYAAGFSNGAVLTELLGCELAGTFAAIAPVAGPLAASLAGTCVSSRPLSVFEVQGTTDPVIPYDGGSVNSAVGGSVLSEATTIALWTARDGCGADPVGSSLPAAPNDGSGVVVMTYGHCANGTAVDAVSIVGGQHEWPGDVTGVSASGGVPADAFSASVAVWSFLSEFRLT